MMVGLGSEALGRAQEKGGVQRVWRRLFLAFVKRSQLEKTGNLGNFSPARFCLKIAPFSGEWHFLA